MLQTKSHINRGAIKNKKIKKDKSGMLGELKIPFDIYIYAPFSYDFNPMVKKSWMDVKFGLVTNHDRVVCVKRLD